MPVTVVVGGQFGSEGKGKVAHALAQEKRAGIAVRVGGTNSGHTVVDARGNKIILRQLPTAAILPGVICVLGAGSYIDPDILLQEVALTHLKENCLKIDPNAAVITEREKREEASSTLRHSIASTLSGTGATVSRRVARIRGLRLAKDEQKLGPFIAPVSQILRTYLRTGGRVLIEGTQGFGLSVLHSHDYPYVTSRDTTAAAFVSEAGLSPLDVDEVILVIRAFPIRVGGNSGPLPNEIDWKTVSVESGSPEPIVERTSVTNVVRRVARLHSEIVKQAIIANRPTHIALNHLDYVDAVSAFSNVVSWKIEQFVAHVESLIGTSVYYYGFGPSSLVARDDELRNAVLTT